MLVPTGWCCSTASTNRISISTPSPSCRALISAAQSIFACRCVGGVLRDRLSCSLALSGGVHTSRDAVKGLLAGANVVMSTSALLRFGPELVRELLGGISQWLDQNDYESVAQMRGSMSQNSVPEPDAYERSNYLKVLRHGADRYLPQYIIDDE